MSRPAQMNSPLQRLEELVPLCSSIRRGTEYGAALTQATGEVLKAATVPDRLESLEPVLRVLKGTQQLCSGEVLPDLEKLGSAGHQLEQCASTEALKDARFSVRDAQEALQRIESLISRAWSAHVQAEFSPLQRLGAVLAGIPDTKSAGAALQKWATDAQSLSGRGAPTLQSVKNFIQAQAEVVDRLEVLRTLGIDTAVRVFLLEVAAENATLANLTPAVLEWLRAKNAHSRFRVELG
jgi:hypothetical protein